MAKLDTNTILASIGGIDGTAVGVTNLFTVPAGRQCSVSRAIARYTVANALTGFMRAGIGIAAGEDDIFVDRNMSGFITLIDQYIFSGVGTVIITGSIFLPVSNTLSLISCGIVKNKIANSEKSVPA